ncbi:MAG: ArnT family glycosyltransferase [Phycisphaerae bacterium]
MPTDSCSRSFLRSPRFGCFLLFALAFAVRAVGLGFGLPDALARPDEEAIVGNALVLENRPDWNPQSFSYPSLMVYAAYGAFKVMHALMRFAGDTSATTLNALFRENPACFHWAVRLLSLFCGALTPVVVAATARRLFGLKTAVSAGLLLALSYLHVRDSHFGVTDVPFVFLVCLSFHQLAKLYLGGSFKHLVFAAIFAGLAIGTKYTGAWLCWPFAVALGRSALRRPPEQRARALVAGGLTAAGVTLLVFFLSTPYFFLDFERAWPHFRWEMMLVQAEPPIVPGINGYIDHFRTSLWYGLGWPVLLIAIASGVAMAVRRSGKGLLLWSLPALFYLYVGHSNRIFIRYMDLVLPFLAIAAGWGVRSAVLRLRRRRRPPASPTPRFLPVAVTLLCLIPSIDRIVRFDRQMTKTDTRLELRQWLVSHVPENEPILWSGGWSAMPYMIHHVPVRTLHATEKLRERFLDEPTYLYRYRWIVLVEWPRAYYLEGKNVRERAYLAQFMAGRYRLVHAIDADKADLPAEWFSALDHFYMSFPRPGIIERPGPGFRIYQRID